MKKLPPKAYLTVVSLPLNRLDPDPRNPRLHSPRQIRQIARSIESFGFVVPILIDRNNTILAGEGRYRASEKLGLRKVPCIRLEHLTPEQAKALRIADNRLTENSSWDEQLLGESLKQLSEAELDFTIEATGFEMGEIDLRIERLGLSSAGGVEDNADNLPPVVEGPAVSRLGDRWHLGSHRIICANSLDPEAFDRLMGDEQADLVFIDPPYNVAVEGHASGLGRIRHRNFAMACGEMNEAQFTSFLTVALSHLRAHSRNGAILFVCMDWRHLAELLAAGKSNELELKNICIWEKHNAGMGSLYRSAYENVVVFKSGRAAHRNNIELGRYGRNRSNVWSYPAINDFGRASEEGHLLSMHPTVKPTRLVADALADCSARRGIVLDSFLGSGTTIIAAERTGRRCYGLELDPHYVDTTIRRWQAYTGEHAVHVKSGKRFDAIAAAMEARHG